MLRRIYRTPWGIGALVLGAVLLLITGRAATSADAEEVRKLTERYDQIKPPAEPRPAPAPKPKPRAQPKPEPEPAPPKRHYRPKPEPEPEPPKRPYRPKPRPVPVSEPEAEMEPEPVQEEETTTPRPTMVRIKGGCFQMGSPTDEEGRDNDERLHEVCVENFELGKHEVTVGEFRRFVEASGYQTEAEKDAGGNKGCRAWSAVDKKWDWREGLSWRKPGYGQGERQPVVCVSWNDAVAYTVWLSGETQQSYRLPTEAEWEYAARAGTTSARYWGDDAEQACRYANGADQTKSPEGSSWNERYHHCSDGYWYPAPVGSFKANAWGLGDMLGNVWEWTCSKYTESYDGSEQKCSKNDTTGPYALRGGSWNNGPAWVRSANRDRGSPANRNDFLGFRLARSL